MTQSSENAPNYLYFLEGSENPPEDAIPFERGYLNNQLTVERREGKTTLKGNHGGLTVESGDVLFQNLATQFMVYMKGASKEGPGFARTWLTRPWRAVFDQTTTSRDGWIPYPGDLPSYFYRRRIGIFAGPGTGKTCLAREISNYLSIHMGISADNSYEFATTFISRWGGPTFSDQTWLMLKQWEREEDISRCKQILISDCPHPLAYLYAKDLARKEGRGTDKSIPWLHTMALKGIETFDTRIYLPHNPDRVKKDGVRIHDVDQAAGVDRMIKGFLEETSLPYITYSENCLPVLINSIFYLNPHVNLTC